MPEEVVERLRVALTTANAVIFESEATREMLQQMEPAARTRCIRYGIELDKITQYEQTHDRDAIRRAFGFSPADRVLLCIGTLTERKAQIPLVNEFATVLDEFPNAKLVLVGYVPTAYGVAVKRRVVELGIEDSVQVIDVDPDHYRWYACADILVNASDSESLPRSFLEGMAFGFPYLPPTFSVRPRLSRTVPLAGCSNRVADRNSGKDCVVRWSAARRNSRKCPHKAAARHAVSTGKLRRGIQGSFSGTRALMTSGVQSLSGRGAAGGSSKRPSTVTSRNSRIHSAGCRNSRKLVKVNSSQPSLTRSDASMGAKTEKRCSSDKLRTRLHRGEATIHFHRLAVVEFRPSRRKVHRSCVWLPQFSKGY